jgi:hypothetical protein
VSEHKEHKPLIGILMGSDTDLPVMSESAKMLEKFGIPYEIEVTSAHRSPARTHEYATTAGARGLKVLIVAAGGAAHLAGVIAAVTKCPRVYRLRRWPLISPGPLTQQSLPRKLSPHLMWKLGADSPHTKKSWQSPSRKKARA